MRKSATYLLLPIMTFYALASDGLAVKTRLSTINHGFALTANPFRYSSYYSDLESKMCYLKARYYSPKFERFISRDTYDLSNRHAYCDGNPMSNIDPSGHMPESAKQACSLLSNILSLSPNPWCFVTSLALGAAAQGDEQNSALSWILGGAVLLLAAGAVYGIICKNCGQEVEAGAAKCQRCGVSISASSSASSAEMATVPSPIVATISSASSSGQPASASAALTGAGQVATILATTQDLQFFSSHDCFCCSCNNFAFLQHQRIHEWKITCPHCGQMYCRVESAGPLLTSSLTSTAPSAVENMSVAAQVPLAVARLLVCHEDCRCPCGFRFLQRCGTQWEIKCPDCGAIQGNVSVLMLFNL